MAKAGRGLAVALVLALGAVPVANGGTVEDGLESAAKFRKYRVYHTGTTFADHPISWAARGRDVHGKASFSFIYGDCTPEPAEDTGCAPPFEIQNYRICSRNPSTFPSEYRGIRSRGIRGAAVYEWRGPGWFDRLEAYTGTTTVAVFTNGDRALARRIVAGLVSADGRVGASDRLAPPLRGALSGRRNCYRG